nr:MAG: hypothetical protein 3 [Leviviridae sp.]
MKSPEEVRNLLLLWQVLASELAGRCRTSTTRDFTTVVSRAEHEGLSFLTITLPTFGKDFQKALAVGMVDRSLFQGFKWKGGLPAFLSGFLGNVFDRKSGRLVGDPDVESIFAIRQLTLLFGKILIPCTPERVEKAMWGFLDCEKEVKSGDNERTEADYLEFTRVSRLLWSDVFSSVDREVYGGSLLPRHGPGATADRLRGNRKFEQREWPSRLDRMFPFQEYVLPNLRYHGYLDRVHFLEPGAERPVKVTPVPKTLDTPRLIAIEPTAMQYMQQAVATSLVRALESRDEFSGIRSGYSSSEFGWLVGFRDRVPNQEMARDGSRDGALATLDLSEASDRVSNQLVRRMLAPHPWLAEGVESCRSRRAAVEFPSGKTKVIRLGKFASMGSALTFPIEALVFSTCAILGIEKALNRRLTKKDVRSLRGRVRVYGDDIIVPVEYVHSVVKVLETFGFQVNRGKSFWTGKFRESCGGDYYDGEDITIVRCRRLFPTGVPTQRRNVLETISLVSLRNRFYEHGLWSTARYLDEVIGRILKFYPTISRESPALGRVTFLKLRGSTMEPQKWSARAQEPVVKAYWPQATAPESHLDDVWALMKVFLSSASRDVPYTGPLDPGMVHQHEENNLPDWFLRVITEGEPSLDSDHLERSGRPDAVDIKLRWGSYR